MLFNSTEFAIFVLVVFVGYWFFTAKNLWLQNLLVLVASYVFYGWWDWRFLSLIAFSSLVDYFVGLAIGGQEDHGKRKFFLGVSVVVNLGLLGVFKYFNFFVDSFSEAVLYMGWQVNPWTLQVILPVGISFYTFQTLSYSIDVYRMKLEPTRDWLAFFAFVAFFPQLVAGPIERASNLLPQFFKKRNFHYEQAADGLRQILWGLFKKVVIADNCAIYVNEIFGNYHNYGGLVLLLGAVFFSFQIYGDFSGYSDIAIGVARLFGFELKKNFAYPYFSRDVAEFWRRWHISLTTWFRDYVYIPLGGSRGKKLMQARNVFVIFLVSGIWHGANWTFVALGALNAAYFLPLMVFGRNRRHLNDVAEGRILPGIREFFQIGTTFLLITLSWVFFRSNSIGMAGEIFSKIFLGVMEVGSSGIMNYLFQSVNSWHLFLVGLMVMVEWLARHREFGFHFAHDRRWRVVRWASYYVVFFLIIYFRGGQSDFIYFQF